METCGFKLLANTTNLVFHSREFAIKFFLL